MTPLVSLALITLLQLFPHYREAHPRHWHIQHWAIEVDTHRFTGAKSCRLERERVSYRREALVFRFAEHIDTSGATYRIDAGTPQSAKADLVTLAKLGFALYSNDLDNPTGGIVRIPIARLESARSVWIQPRTDHYPVEFPIAGLAAALDSERAAGCTDAAFD